MSNFFTLEKKYIKDQVWDDAVSATLTDYVFAKKWYLDLVCENWLAAVYGDFEFIMPLPYKNFFGMKLVYTPAFIPYLGVFSRAEIQDYIFDSLVSALPKSFVLTDLRLNKFTTTGREHKKRFYYSLDLLSAYEDIFSSYSPEARKIIGNASDYKIYSGINPITLKQLMFQHNSLSATKIKLLTKLMAESLIKRTGAIYVAYKGEKVAGFAFFVISKSDIDLVFATAFDDDDFKVITLLIDNFIKKNINRAFNLNFTCPLCEHYEGVFQALAQRKFYYPQIVNTKFSKVLRWINK